MRQELETFIKKPSPRMKGDQEYQSLMIHNFYNSPLFHDPQKVRFFQKKKTSAFKVTNVEFYIRMKLMFN